MFLERTFHFLERKIFQRKGRKIEEEDRAAKSSTISNVKSGGKREREGHPRENKGYEREREREGFRARTLLENEDLDYARVEWNVPRGAKTSTPVVVGKGIPKLLPSLKIVVDDEDGRFRGRKLVEREGRERDRRGDNASSSIETPVLSLLSPSLFLSSRKLAKFLFRAREGKGKRFSPSTMFPNFFFLSSFFLTRSRI